MCETSKICIRRAINLEGHRPMLFLLFLPELNFQSACSWTHCCLSFYEGILKLLRLKQSQTWSTWANLGRLTSFEIPRAVEIIEGRRFWYAKIGSLTFKIGLQLIRILANVLTAVNCRRSSFHVQLRFSIMTVLSMRWFGKCDLGANRDCFELRKDAFANVHWGQFVFLVQLKSYGGLVFWRRILIC
jgi:hypothetical protein